MEFCSACGIASVFHRAYSTGQHFSFLQCPVVRGQWSRNFVPAFQCFSFSLEPRGLTGYLFAARIVRNAHIFTNRGLKANTLINAFIPGEISGSSFTWLKVRLASSARPCTENSRPCKNIFPPSRLASARSYLPACLACCAMLSQALITLCV